MTRDLRQNQIFVLFLCSLKMCIDQQKLPSTIPLIFSDLLLCLVTSPLTLIEILSKFWPYGKSFMVTWLMLIFKLNLGDSQLICKSIGMLQGISIFVSLLAVQIEFDLLEKICRFQQFPSQR